MSAKILAGLAVIIGNLGIRKINSLLEPARQVKIQVNAVPHSELAGWLAKMSNIL